MIKVCRIFKQWINLQILKFLKKFLKSGGTCKGSGAGCDKTRFLNFEKFFPDRGDVAGV